MTDSATPQHDSPAMLDIAFRAQDAGLYLCGCAIRGRSMLPLQEETAETGEENIVTAIRESVRSEALAALEGPDGPYRVVELEFEDDLGDSVVLTHHGDLIQGHYGGDKAVAALQEVIGPRMEGV